MTLPAALEVAGRAVLVVGGTADSLGVLGRLLDERARVTVASPSVATTVRDLADRGLLTWLARPAEAADYRAAALVVAATGTAAGDAEVHEAAVRENRLVLALREPVPRPGQGLRQAQPAEGTAQPAEGTAQPAEGVAQQAEGALPAGGTAQPAQAGSVTLVGGGPGDPGLLTVAGLAAVRSADVLVCDRLAPLAVLAEAPAHAEVIDVGKIPRGPFTPQERINDLLVEHARSGRRVVRLKGGDSFVFGRGGEEWQACAAAGIAVRVVPGVSSALAGPALAGIPLTHRTLTQGFTVVSGHLPPGDPGSTLDWGALARSGTTLVVLMGLATLPAVTDELRRHGLAADTPAATVVDAGLPSQRVVPGTLATIAALGEAADLRPPAVTVIGAVAGFDPYGSAPEMTL